MQNIWWASYSWLDLASAIRVNKLWNKIHEYRKPVPLRGRSRRWKCILTSVSRDTWRYNYACHWTSIYIWNSFLYDVGIAMLCKSYNCRSNTSEGYQWFSMSSSVYTYNLLYFWSLCHIHICLIRRRIICLSWMTKILILSKPFVRWWQHCTYCAKPMWVELQCYLKWSCFVNHTIADVMHISER